MSSSDEFELRASARLLAYDLRSAFLARLALLIAGGIVLPLTGHPALGFGLSLVKKIIATEHRGSVELESKKGIGTTAVVMLPLEQDATLRP